MPPKKVNIKKKKEKENAVYLVFDSTFGDSGEWIIFDSLPKAHDTYPNGSLIYKAKLELLGKTRSILIPYQKD